MRENIDPQSKDRDEALASFTDQLIEPTPDNETSDTVVDEDMKELQETVAMMWELYGHKEPNDAMRKRIYQRLVAEWKVREEKDMNSSFSQRLSEWLDRQTARQKMMLATAIALLFLVAGVGLFPFSNGPSIAGAAGSGRGIAVIAVVVGGLMVGFFLWMEAQDS